MSSPQQSEVSTSQDRLACKRRGYEIAPILVFSIGVIGFALTAHREAWLTLRTASLVLVGVGLIIGWSCAGQISTLIIGKPHRNHPFIRIAIVACLAIPASIGYRLLLETTILPSHLYWFAFVAMTVGLTEEILWRGWMQGILTGRFGPWVAVPTTALSHTAYKTALFVFPPSGISERPTIALVVIAALTFGFGAFLGVIRYRQGTVASPVAFHMVFDLLVYGGCDSIPWWVC